MIKRKGYFNKKICAGCGECCKQNGCGFLPSDFKSMDYEYIKSRLEDNDVSIIGELLIDVSALNIPVWNVFLSMRTRNVDREVIDLISYYNTCSMLKEDGCSYSDQERPAFGRNLKPMPDRNCIQMIDTDMFKSSWLPYQEMLGQLVFDFTGKTVRERIEDDIEKVKEEIMKRYPNSFKIKRNGDFDLTGSIFSLDDDTRTLYTAIDLKQHSAYGGLVKQKAKKQR